MIQLTLEVVGGKAARMGAEARKTFTEPGTIGRLPDNDWVFPDEYISGHHAKILLANGTFSIEDTSTNGVFVNSQQNRLPRGRPHPLRNGDRLFIDDYEVRVSLSEEAAVRPDYATPPRGAYSGALIPEEPLFEGPDGSPGAPNSTDPLKLLGLQDEQARPADTGAAGLHNASPLAQHYRPPTPRTPLPPAVPPPPPAGAIPDDYDPMGPEDDPFDGPPLTPAPYEFAAPPPAIAPSSKPPAAVPLSRAPPPAAPPTRSAPMPPSSQSGAAPTIVTGPPRVPKPGVRTPAADARPTPPGKTPPSRAPAPLFEDPFESSARNPSVQPPQPAPPPRAIPPPGAYPNTAAGAASAGAGAASPVAGAASAAPSAAFAAPGRSAPPPDLERRAPSSGGDLDFAAMLEAAGIDPLRMTPELSRQFGKILRVVVEGLMEVLRARDQIKDEFRMRMTTFKQADNNPLKFSANVEDALHNLLVKRNAAYLGPVEAFEDAFLDVRNHQMAMLAGVRVAYEAMLKSFDPDLMQKEFETLAKGANFLSGGARAKYWELYTNRFRAMVKDADSSFRHLFGNDFAKAYEEQLSRLKAASRAGASGSRRQRD